MEEELNPNVSDLSFLNLQQTPMTHPNIRNRIDRFEILSNSFQQLEYRLNEHMPQVVITLDEPVDQPLKLRDVEHRGRGGSRRSLHAARHSYRQGGFGALSGQVCAALIYCVDEEEGPLLESGTETTAASFCRNGEILRGREVRRRRLLLLPPDRTEENGGGDSTAKVLRPKTVTEGGKEPPRRPSEEAARHRHCCCWGISPTAGAHHGRLRRRIEKRERRDGGSFPSPLRFLTTVALADAPSLQAAAFVDGNQGRSTLQPELTIGGRLALLDRRQLVARKAHCRSHTAAPLIVAAIIRSSLAKGVRNSPS
nr:hypothetical protein Iba_chr11aCG13400 [Ipomoea batatas]